MNRKMCCRFAMAGIMAGLLLGARPAPAPAEVKRKEPAKKNSAPAPEVKIPEIGTIGVIQGRGEDRLLSGPLALTLDEKNGDLLVTSFESEEVTIFDKSGALIKRMGPESGLRSPYGIALDSKGNILVSEIRSGLLKIFSSAGTLVDEVDLSKVLGRRVAPGRIGLGKGGLIYIADLQENEILVFSEKGDFVRSLGKTEFLQKVGSAGDGKIVVLSAMGTAVQVFGDDGKKLFSFGKHGDAPEKNFSFPSGFAVDARGRLWIADAFQHRLSVYTLDGKFLFTFGRMEEKPGDGGLFFPVDLCFGKDGTLYLLEKGANRLQVYQVSDLKE